MRPDDVLARSLQTSRSMRWSRLLADAGRFSLLLYLATMGGCSVGRRAVPPVSTPPAASSSQVGIASWYGAEFEGRRTASGQRFDPRRFTAAHRSLPLGTRVRVENVANKRSVNVTITDRGPFVRGRVLDLSRASAE